MNAIMTDFVKTFNSKLDEPIRTHLKNVYGVLTMSTLAASVGVYVDMYVFSAGLLSTFASIGLLIAIISTPMKNKNMMLMRIGLLMGLSFFTGMGLGPLIDLVAEINPSIIVTALIGTTVIFISFSLCAMLAPQGKWLYLGGPLMTLFNTMALMALANIFFHSYMIFQVNLYLGMLVMCGFVLYDTQLIIEKKRNGDADFVRHALDLFIDFVAIFRRLLIILAGKEQQRKRKD